MLSNQQKVFDALRRIWATAHIDASAIQHPLGVKMLKSLFNQTYSKRFLDKIESRRGEYYEKRRIKTINKNAMLLAGQWKHEYPTGTPIEYIRDDIIECWEKRSQAGIYSYIDKGTHDK